MVPFNNIESHAKAERTEPEAPTQQRTARKTQTETQSLDHKNFFSAHNVQPLPRNDINK